MAVDMRTEGNIAILTINRPEARNAINHEVSEEMEGHLDTFEGDDDLWIGIVAGNGKAFCAGADLKAVSAGMNIQTERGGLAGIASRQRTKPLIAAVDGAALAGGLEVVLSCDMVVASTAARFGIPEVKRSLVAAAGGLFRLPRVIPTNIAMQMALTGDPITAEQAHTFGLVNRLVQPGQALDAALELAAEITVNAPLAVRWSRMAIVESEGLQDDEAWEVTRNYARMVFKTEDFKEGPRAFIEKRAPNWTGR
jgi:enoyl-CoA hydratase